MREIKTAVWFHITDPAYQKNVMLILIFWKSVEMLSINSPHMTFFAKLTQCWSKVVISTTRRRIKFDVVVSVLQRRYEFDVSKNFWGSYFFKTLWISVSENLKSLFSRTRLHAYGWMHKKPESNKSLWGCLFNKLISNFLCQLQFDWRIYFRGE